MDLQLASVHYVRKGAVIRRVADKTGILYLPFSVVSKLADKRLHGYVTIMYA